jgi:hypothetical protein
MAPGAPEELSPHSPDSAAPGRRKACRRSPAHGWTPQGKQVAALDNCCPAVRAHCPAADTAAPGIAELRRAPDFGACPVDCLADCAALGPAVRKNAVPARRPEPLHRGAGHALPSSHMTSALWPAQPPQAKLRATPTPHCACRFSSLTDLVSQFPAILKPRFLRKIRCNCFRRRP